MEHKKRYRELRKLQYLSLDSIKRKKLNYERRSKQTKTPIPLVFTYLIPTSTLEYIDELFGIKTQMHDDQPETTISSLRKLDPDKVSEPFNKDLENHEIDVDIKNPKYNFVNKNINQHLIQEQDYSFESEEMFQIVKALVPRTENLRRVVFMEGMYSTILRVELSLMIMPVIFLVDKWTTDKVTQDNIFEYVDYLPLSKYLVWYELIEIFCEHAKSKWDLGGMDISNSPLRLLPDGMPDELDREQWASDLLEGKTKTENLKHAAIDMSKFNTSSAFLFHIKHKSDNSFVTFTNSKYAQKNGRGGSNAGKTSANGYSTSGVTVSGAGGAYSSRRNYYNNYTSFKEDFENEITNRVVSSSINDGLVGFKNIGNTCYMNSAMQCLIHLPFLKEFILGNHFSSMINTDNPIGTNGDMVKSLAALMKEYFTTRSASVAPYCFKRCVSKYMTAFEGYSHHDSQEFLSQMLDKCHEDTNQILKKPYIEVPTLKPGEKSDMQLAREAWVRYLKRNNSYFVHNFYGQFKSQIKCPTCRSEFLKFDAFQVVSLPVPTLNSNNFDFYLVLNDQKRKAVKLPIKIKSYLNFRDIRVKMLRAEIEKKIIKDSQNQNFTRTALTSFGKNHIAIYDETPMIEITYREVGEYSSDLNLFVFQLNKNDIDLLHGKGRRLKDKTLTVYEPLSLKVNVDDKEVQDKFANEEYLTTRKDLVFVGCVFLYDYYDDDSNLDYQIKKFRKRYSYSVTETSPIFSKFFYVSTQQRVVDLLLRVYEKFYFKTEGAGGKTADALDSFREFTTSDSLPFYLRIDGDEINEEDWWRPVSDFAELYEQSYGEQQLHVQVFFREGERKINLRKTSIPKIEFEYFTTCRDIELKQIQIYPGNFESFENKSYSLEYLLENFSRPETLDNQNMYRCGKCKKEVKAEITMQIQKLPKLLVVFFKRIKNGYSGSSTTITYKEVLDMRPFVNDQAPIEAYDVRPDEILDEANIELYLTKLAESDSEDSSDSDEIDDIEEYGKSSPIKTEKPSKPSLKGSSAQVTRQQVAETIYLPDPGVKTDMQYELVGVVDHYGSQNFGHYTCMTKVDGEGWYEFNDRSYSKVRHKDIFSKNAYMLFYLRKDQ